jgi:hypothetical protein
LGKHKVDADIGDLRCAQIRERKDTRSERQHQRLVGRGDVGGMKEGEVGVAKRAARADEDVSLTGRRLGKLLADNV